MHGRSLGSVVTPGHSCVEPQARRTGTLPSIKRGYPARVKLLDRLEEEFVAGTADRVLAHLAALLLRPYVTGRTCWIVRHHGLFQYYYYAHHVGGDRNARDKYRDHPWYQDAVDFCHNWDQCAFDPDYESLPLEFFEPMVRRVFAREPFGLVAGGDL